jgi:hypothetical protein
MSQNSRIQNSNNAKKFNYTKWGFILGTLIAVAGVVATVATVPEARCSLGLKSEACVVQKREVELITLTETGNPLALVRIQVISQGAPEVTQTDNSGYGKVKIPSTGDVNVILSKEGYPTQRFWINLENDQSTTRTILLSQSGSPEVKSSTGSSPLVPVSSPSTTTPSPETTSTPSISSKYYVGNWIGHVTEKNPQDNSSKQYFVRIELINGNVGSSIGKIHYKILGRNGDGVLILQSETQDSIELFENITAGDGLRFNSNGTVTIKRLGQDFLDFKWTTIDSPITITGKLTRNSN